MFKSILAVVAIFLCGLNGAFAGAKIDPELRSFARGESDRKTVTVIGLLESPQSGFLTPRRYDSVGVVRYLRERTRVAWQVTGEALDRAGMLGGDILLKRVHWINNSFVAEVTPEGLKTLSYAPGISKIYLNRAATFDMPKVVRDRFNADDDAFPYNFIETGMDRLVREAPQVDGSGVLLGSVDTGVDATHPALEGKIRAFFDGTKGRFGEPSDSSSHGTHTIGTMVGGERGKNNIGMAPGAKIFAAGMLRDHQQILSQMEIMLKPAAEGSQELPRAVNNSWNVDGTPDLELFYRAISAWEAAGIVPVFSAGNKGPGYGSITSPKEHPATIAVGATGRTGKVTVFSSRGPAVYKGQRTQKPELTAPGEDIDSTVLNGKMGKMSGTSMAAPHVAGVIALLTQVEPRLNPAQIRAILIGTTEPTSSDGHPGRAGKWNGVYGYGKLNAYAAVRAAMDYRNKRENLLLAGAVDLINQLLGSLKSVDVLALAEGSSDLGASDLAFPQEAEGDSWLTAEQVWL